MPRGTRQRMHVHLASGILERDGRILLVASRYPNQPDPLWNLPGGRLREGELLEAAVRREFSEETGLRADVRALRYLSESYDGATGTHFVSAVFGVHAQGEPRLAGGDAHVVDLQWVARADLARYVSVRVVRDPLLGHLGDERRRYFGFAEAGITIEFAEPP